MMFIVQIINELCIFDYLIVKLLSYIQTTRILILVLVLICFLSSIFITNDIALITFVPFTILTLKKAYKLNLIIITVSLQTIAANMGSMILPIGSPHNILLFTVSKLSFFDFTLILLPYITISFLFLIIIILFIPNEKILDYNISIKKFNKKGFFIRVFKGIDYFLILTFIVLFILIGNLENIHIISSLFKQLIVNNELITSILISQMISNVPSAMLVTTFSSNYYDIIIGINIGGLGTLIASMANLISFKIFVNEFPYCKFKYLKIFSILNIILLAILLCFSLI